MGRTTSRASGAAEPSGAPAVPALDGVRHEYVQAGDLRMHVALGHFLPEECPERVADAARSLFARAA